MCDGLTLQPGAAGSEDGEGHSQGARWPLNAKGPGAGLSPRALDGTQACILFLPSDFHFSHQNSETLSHFKPRSL